MSLRDAMDRFAIAGELFTTMPEGVVACHACAHRCQIIPGRRGICRVRFNEDGVLKVPAGYVISAAADPVEKKPLYHFLPGSIAFTFGMLGCNLRCDFCQNWDISQPFGEMATGLDARNLRTTTPQQMTELALRHGARLMVSSYNEPLITSEWGVQIFREARQAGLKTAFISNGFATHEVLDYLRPHLDAFKVDLKSFDAEKYRQLGGGLDEVLESIRYAHEIGLWVEVVTLVIPQYNDSPRELYAMAEAIRSVSAEIPWHVTAFHPDYKMLDRYATEAESLMQAVEVGQEAGLKYVYAGNLPGRVRNYEDTHCPTCQAVLIKRRGMRVLENRLAGGACPACGTAIAGVFE